MMFSFAGLWIDIMCKGGVALFSNTVRYPAAMLLCSACMTIGIAALSQKFYNTAIGRFLSFCGRSTLIFMGFNYFLRTVWRMLPVLKQYKAGIFPFIGVTIALVLMSLAWEKARPHFHRFYLYLRRWMEFA